MEKKYISEKRYKKSTNKKRRDVSSIRKMGVTKKSVTTKKAKTVKRKSKSKVSPKIRKEKRITRSNIVICILLLIAIAAILRVLLKEEGEPFIPIFFGEEENEQVITVGIVTEENLLNENINNVILKELEVYSKRMLLHINSDYSLKYDAVQSVEKRSELEYYIKLNGSNEYNSSSVKKVLDEYRQNTASIYYTQLQDILSIATVDAVTLKITLKTSNPYFIYNLDIPLCYSERKEYVKSANSTSSSLEFIRTKYASEQAPMKIVVKKYKDMYDGVEAYKKEEINMLITNQKNVQNMLGKYEYNLKTYRTGETIFMFFNNQSEWFKNEEIRKVIAYSIDRDTLAKNTLNIVSDIIDLPYIYDRVKYKYDIYAAENLLLSNGYKKVNKVYSKDGKQVSLKLIVNKNDEEKVNIATAIKNNLAAVGVNINIEKLTTANMTKAINKGNYDLVLSTVNLNNNPDVSFLKNNIYMTENINNALNNIYKAEEANITEKNKQLVTVMSNDIACVGIVAKTSYVIYKKDIVGLGDIEYLQVFSNLINS